MPSVNLTEAEKDLVLKALGELEGPSGVAAPALRVLRSVKRKLAPTVEAKTTVEALDADRLIHKGCGERVELDEERSGAWGDFFKCPIHGGGLGRRQIEERETDDRS